MPYTDFLDAEGISAFQTSLLLLMQMRVLLDTEQREAELFMNMLIIC